jgi:hypothetical protein
MPTDSTATWGLAPFAAKTRRKEARTQTNLAETRAESFIPIRRGRDGILTLSPKAVTPARGNALFLET